MKKSLYKITAWILIVLGILIIVGTTYFHINDSIIKYNRTGFIPIGNIIFEGLGIILLTIIFGFLPARFYLKVANNEKKENKLIKSSLILTALFLIFFFIGFLIGSIKCGGRCDPLDFYAPILLGSSFGGILYIIAVILLIINKFRKSK